MALQANFPKNLLNEPPDARLNYFKSHWAAHAKIRSVAAKILDLIRNPADALLIYLMGPTGVGKSTVLRYVLKVLYEEAMPELEKDPSKIPAAYILAPHAQSGTYDWTEHFIRTMRAVNDVLIDQKIYLPDPHQKIGDIESDIKRSKGSPRALRRGAAKALQNRIWSVFMIDDAHYIGKRSSGEHIIGQANTIKSLADESGVPFLLAGTFELLPLRNLNGQLGRRSVTIHFENYKHNISKDREAFISVLKNFLMHLPLVEPPDFSEHWEFCYERCLGCVGILKDWLYYSLAEALKKKKATMPFELFKEHAPSIAVCLEISHEITAGEGKLKENEDEQSLALLRANLGIKEKRQTKTENRLANNDIDMHGVSTQPPEPPSPGAGNLIPFNPKPHRYQTGDNSDDL